MKIRYEGTTLAAGLRSEQKAEVEVLMDGKPVPVGSRDADLAKKGERTFVVVEGERHLHLIKEDMARMHEIELFVKAKGLQVLGFYY